MYKDAWPPLCTNMATPTYKYGHAYVQGWPPLCTNMATPMYKYGHPYVKIWPPLCKRKATPACLQRTHIPGRCWRGRGTAVGRTLWHVQAEPKGGQVYGHLWARCKCRERGQAAWHLAPVWYQILHTQRTDGEDRSRVYICGVCVCVCVCVCVRDAR
jgi:hypothetical protein